PRVRLVARTGVVLLSGCVADFRGPELWGIASDLHCRRAVGPRLADEIDHMDADGPDGLGLADPPSDRARGPGRQGLQGVALVRGRGDGTDFGAGAEAHREPLTLLRPARGAGGGLLVDPVDFDSVGPGGDGVEGAGLSTRDDHEVAVAFTGCLEPILPRRPVYQGL